MNLRELTKSFFSLSWAMSLFGVQQMFNLARPKQAAQAFDAVADAAAEGFDGATRSAYQAGNRWQRQMVDAALSVFSRDALDPASLMRSTSDVLRQSAASVSEGLQGATATMQSVAQDRPPVGARPGGAAKASPGWGGPDTVARAAAPPAAAAGAETRGWGPMPGTSPRT